MRDTLPGLLNVSVYPRIVSSQAFVTGSHPTGCSRTLIPDDARTGLEFKATHPKAEEAHEWMGFEARSVIHELLDEAVKKKADVRVIAFDLNLPEDPGASPAN